MNRHSALKSLFAVTLALTAFVSPLVTQSKPNLLIIVADDLGYYDVGFQGYNAI